MIFPDLLLIKKPPKYEFSESLMLENPVKRSPESTDGDILHSFHVLNGKCKGIQLLVNITNWYSTSAKR